MQTNEKRPGLKNESQGVYTLRLTAAFVFIVAAAAFIPAALLMDLMYSYLYMNLMISVAITVFGIAICSKLIGSFRPMLPICIIAGLSIFFSVLTPAVGAILPVFFCLSALAAYLIRERFAPLMLVAGVVGTAAAILLTKNIFCAPLSLLFIPVAYTLNLLFKNKKQRVSSVCTLSFVLGAPMAALFLAYLFINEGTISIDVIKNFFTALREALIKALSETLVEASNQAGATAEIISIADATALMREMISSAFNLLPALFIVSLFVISFLIHSLYISLIEHTVEDKKEIINAITFGMSLTSAITFLLAFIAAIIFSKEKPQISVAAQNIYTILYPGLTMITFAFLGARKKGEPASCLPVLLYMMLLAMLVFITDVALTVASISGAIIIILSEIRKHKKNESDNDNFN